MSDLKKEFYIYVYMDTTKPGVFVYDDLILEYEPFYIGKGKGSRYKQHIIDSRNRKLNNKKLYHIHNKILKLDNNIKIIKVKENLLEFEAFEYEKKYIALIGRHDRSLGPLCNNTDGGDGESGRIPWNKGKNTGPSWNSGLTKDTDPRVEKISAALKGVPKPKSTNWIMTDRAKSAAKQNIINENKRRTDLGLGSGFKGKTFSKEIKQMMKETWAKKRGHRVKIYYFIKDNKLIIIRGLTDYAKKNNLSNGNLNLLFNGKKKEYKGYTTIKKEEIKNWINNYEIFDSYKEKLEPITIENII